MPASLLSVTQPRRTAAQCTVAPAEAGADVQRRAARCGLVSAEMFRILNVTRSALRERSALKRGSSNEKPASALRILRRLL